MPLAIETYRSLGRLADDAERLNLAWTLDERQFLSVDLLSLVSRELRLELMNDLEYVNHYFVDDPYGEDYIDPAVETFFSLSGSFCVTCGAGVISLLHCLAALANGRAACLASDIYPDFPFWLTRTHRHCIAV